MLEIGTHLKRICASGLLLSLVGILATVNGCNDDKSPPAVYLPHTLLRQTVWEGDTSDGESEPQIKPPVYPAELLRLDGKSVAIPGYMSPYDDLESLRRFILRPRPVGCRFCSVVEPAEVALVTLSPQSEYTFNPRTLLVTGTLRLWTPAGRQLEHDEFPFLLEDASFREMRPEEVPTELIESHKSPLPVDDDEEEDDF